MNAYVTGLSEQSENCKYGLRRLTEILALHAKGSAAGPDA